MSLPSSEIHQSNVITVTFDELPEDARKMLVEQQKKAAEERRKAAEERLKAIEEQELRDYLTCFMKNRHDAIKHVKQPASPSTSGSEVMHNLSTSN